MVVETILKMANLPTGENDRTGDMYRIRATVNDGLVTSKSMDATLMIENPNLPPEITKFDAPATVRTDEAFNVNVAGKDKYGDDNQLKWT